jgi:hypothetical protein
MSADAAASLVGFAALLRMAVGEVDLLPLQTALIERASSDRDDAGTRWDLSLVLQLTGHRDFALQVQAEALQMQQCFHLPAPAGPTGFRLLAIMGPGDLMANTPIECLLDGTDVALDLLYVGPGLAFPSSVPDHDAVMVCVGENDDNRPLLASLARVLRTWPRPVLNRAEDILWLSRGGVCARLENVPGVAMPVTARTPRATLESMAAGSRPPATASPDEFPILVRPVGSHAGQGLVKIDRPSEIAAYLRGRPEVEFCLTPFVDYRQPDGLFRKYRIALFDGRPFLCHLGISEHWMIHYANAGMAESADKRAEEARVMATFDEDFAWKHAGAFRAIHERMGLDYLAIDCGESTGGRLLVFEVDTSMVIHAMDPVELYPYKQPQMRKVFAAFREMLASRTAGRERARSGRTISVGAPEDLPHTP